MAKVDIGVNLRKTHKWLEECAQPEIDRIEKEIRDCYAEPPVPLEEVEKLGARYRKVGSAIAKLEGLRDEIRFLMLNCWRQHGVTDFPVPEGHYRVVPRKELSVDSDEVRGLVGEAVWESITKSVRVLEPMLLLAAVEQEMKKPGRERRFTDQRLADLVYVDCTPEVRPPRETPKQQDLRVIGKTPSRKNKKKSSKAA